MGLRDPQFGALEALRGRLDRAADLVGELQASEGEGYRWIEGRSVKVLKEASQEARGLAEALKTGLPAGAQRDMASRTVPAILRRLRHQFSGVAGVGPQLDSLLKDRAPDGSRVVGWVLQLRNRAAHPDADGRGVELAKAEVRHALENITQVLLRFSNLGIVLKVEGRGP